MHCHSSNNQIQQLFKYILTSIAQHSALQIPFKKNIILKKKQNNILHDKPSFGDQITPHFPTKLQFNIHKFRQQAKD